MVDVNAIHQEILAGLPNSRERRDRALRNHEFACGDFSRYPSRAVDASDGRRYERTSLFMARVVGALSSLLYREGPRRAVVDQPDVTEWLNAIYRSNNVDALLQQADRSTFVADVALIQVEPSADPDCPIKLRLWDAAWVDVWVDPDEPCRMAAVATIDTYDQRRRLRLWTEEEVREYTTRKYDETTRTAGATAYTLQSATPHGLGCLPFASIHYDVPTYQFWSPGPGDVLAETNDWINKRLTDMFDSVRANLDPVMILKHVESGWAMPKAKPGTVINPPARMTAAGEAMGEPGAEYIQADPSFVAAGWDDMTYAIDHCLEMAGVAPSEVRMVQDATRSGAAIVAEQIPAVSRAKARQRKAAAEEDRLAEVVLRVGSAHLGSPANVVVTQSQPEGEASETPLPVRVSPAQLLAAAEDLRLVLHWPDLWPRIPGTESDQADQWMLDNGLVSRTQLAMARYHLTEEEATAYLETVAKQTDRERMMFEGGNMRADASV